MRRKGISQVQVFFRQAPLLFQRRDSFTIEKGGDDGRYVKSIKGWEADQDKRQAFIAAIKRLGFKFDSAAKAWTSFTPVEHEKIQAILNAQGVITGQGSSASALSSDSKKSDTETRVIELLKNWKEPLTHLLPPHVNLRADAFFESLKIALIKSGKAIETSSDDSIYKACASAAQVHLVPGVLNEAYFLAREGQIEFQIGYKGLIALARRVNPHIQIVANVVREGDQFSYTLGDNQSIELIQDPKADPDKIIYAYVDIIYPKGGHCLTVIDRSHVEKRMKCSAGAKSRHSPWERFMREMWMKTAIREAFRFVHLSPEESKIEGLEAALENLKSVLSSIHNEIEGSQDLSSKVEDEKKSSFKI
jgi:recombination protein RecT